MTELSLEYDVERKKNRKLYNLELYRFVFAVAIMIYHSFYLLRLPKHFSAGGWLCVEFFFIISGYFTVKHFSKQEIVTDVDAGRESIRYTLKKFIPIIKYSWPLVIADYIVMFVYGAVSGTGKGIVVSFIQAPLELLMLASSGIMSGRLNTAWYLSAMFIVFPIFCYFLQKKFGLMVYVLSGLAPILFYGHRGVVNRLEYPDDLLRASCCLLLGGSVYWLSEELKKIQGKRLLFTILEVMCFWSITYFVWTDFVHTQITVLIMYLFAAIIFSQKSYCTEMKGSIFELLGKLSLPLYLAHKVVGDIIRAFFPEFGITTRLVTYIVGTLAVAVGMYLIINFFDKRRKIKCSNNI